MATKGTWYYMTEGQQQGPITMDQLYGLASQGVVKGETKVWCEGWSHWVSYSEYTQSKELQNTAQIAAKKAKGGKGLMIGLIIGGSLVLVGGVILMIVLMSSGGGDRGFDTPEDLADGITDALNSKDPAQIVELFPTREEVDSVIECEEDAEDPYEDIGREIDKIMDDDNPMADDFSAELLDVDVKIKRTSRKGKRKRGCLFKMDVTTAKAKLSYRFIMDGREDDDRIRVEMAKLGDMGWFLTEF